MTDYSREILNLQRARIDMQSAKKVAEVEVKEQYAARIRDEIKRRTEQAELDFAHELALAVEAGVPQRLIRSEVLRTNVWSRWVYWRDLAQIEPERVVIENLKRAKADAERPYRWADDYSSLTILRVNGEEITPFIVRDWSVGNGPVQISYADKFIWLFQGAGLSMKDFDAAAISAIESAYSQGLIPARKSDWDAYSSREIDVTEIERRRAQNIEENGAWDE